MQFIVVQVRSGRTVIGVEPPTRLFGRSWHPGQELLESLSFAMFGVKPSKLNCI
ncbi:MAG: hypothetical protein F6K44_10315 [Moorea sp. SIO3E2]|nr:hypothetical protein [Moorena sp. SIO3E2]